MRHHWLLLSVALGVGGCRPAVERLEYDSNKEQIVFLYGPTGSTQVYFRESGSYKSWTATASSTAERPPPESGPWELTHDWVVVHARDSQLQTASLTSGCTARRDSVSSRAARFHIEGCTEEAACCTENGILLVGDRGRCRTLTGWTTEDGLCVVRNP